MATGTSYRQHTQVSGKCFKHISSEPALHLAECTHVRSSVGYVFRDNQTESTTDEKDRFAQKLLLGLTATAGDLWSSRDVFLEDEPSARSGWRLAWRFPTCAIAVYGAHCYQRGVLLSGTGLVQAQFTRERELPRSSKKHLLRPMLHKTISGWC